MHDWFLRESLFVFELCLSIESEPVKKKVATFLKSTKSVSFNFDHDYLFCSQVMCTFKIFVIFILERIEMLRLELTH